MDYEGVPCNTWQSKYKSRVRWAHAKYDGNHVTIKKDPAGNVRMLTTGGADEWPRLYLPTKTLVTRQLPLDSSIYAELYAPDAPRSEVKHRLASGKGELRIAGFALLRWTGTDVSPSVDLDTVEAIFRGYGIPFAEPLIELPNDWEPETLLTVAKRNGLEGWVLKGHNLLDWYKLKLEQTIDLVVTGFTDGTGENLGLVGSFRCSVTLPDGSLQEVARVGGLDQRTRIEFDEDKDIGRVLEARYQYVGAKGRLVHPRFVRWRDDKTAGVRTGVEQDPELETRWTGDLGPTGPAPEQRS